MEILLRKSFLEHLLTKVETIAVEKDASKWLQSFLLELDDGVLKVARTDTELTAVVYTDKIKVISAEAPTRSLIPAETFGELIPKLDGENVRLILSENRVSIQSAGYSGSLVPSDASEFPSIATGTGDNVMKLPAQNFASALARVNYAASRGQIQDNLRQVMFEGGRCWAIDGFRYQEVVSHLPKGFKLTLPIIAQELANFIKLTKVETLEFEETENFYFFKMGRDLFLCKHSQVIPTSEDSLLRKLNEEKQGVFLTDVEKLRKMLRRVQLTAEEKSGKVHFKVEKKTLTMSAKDEFKNKSQDVIPISLQGNTKEREFDIRWFLLLEALDAINDKSVLVCVDEEFIVLKSDDSKALVPMLRKHEKKNYS